MHTLFPNFDSMTDLSVDTLAPAQRVAGISNSLALTESAAALLRAYLDANELTGYRIYFAGNLDLNDLDHLLPALGETEAVWEALPAMVAGGRTVAQLTHNDGGAWEWPTGIMRLFRHDAVIARWYWIGRDGYSDGNMTLIAVPSPRAFHVLHQAVLAARRVQNTETWQVIGEYDVTSRPPRKLATDGHDALVLDEAILERVRAEVLHFFDPAVGDLYHGLGVPYRRGVLLHGPPGNGKTSLIRWIGASLPNVAAMMLRPWGGFDADDLDGVIKQWTSQSPAILVLEDLDWLLEQVNVSTFLNLLDGITTPPSSAGLLLIATTNHPDKLDSAVNNRPGRFDATIEMPRPSDKLRERFIAAKLPWLAPEALAKAVSIADGLSFAHLQEMLRLSGLRAIHCGRSQRTAEDVLSSLTDIRDANDNAIRGFPLKTPEMPFGLAHLRKAAR